MVKRIPTAFGITGEVDGGVLVIGAGGVGDAIAGIVVDGDFGDGH